MQGKLFIDPAKFADGGGLDGRNPTNAGGPPVPPPKIRKANWVSARWNKLFSPANVAKPGTLATALANKSGDVGIDPNNESLGDIAIQVQSENFTPKITAMDRANMLNMSNDSGKHPKLGELSMSQQNPAYTEDKPTKTGRGRTVMLLFLALAVGAGITVGAFAGAGKLEDPKTTTITKTITNPPTKSPTPGPSSTPTVRDFPELQGNDFAVKREDGTILFGTPVGEEALVKDPSGNGSPVKMLFACSSAPISCISVVFENGKSSSMGDCSLCTDTTLVADVFEVEKTTLDKITIGLSGFDINTGLGDPFISSETERLTLLSIANLFSDGVNAPVTESFEVVSGIPITSGIVEQTETFQIPPGCQLRGFFGHVEQGVGINSLGIIISEPTNSPTTSSPTGSPTTSSPTESPNLPVQRL